MGEWGGGELGGAAGVALYFGFGTVTFGTSRQGVEVDRGKLPSPWRDGSA